VLQGQVNAQGNTQNGSQARGQVYYDQKGRPISGSNVYDTQSGPQRGNEVSEEAHRRNDERKNRNGKKNKDKHDHDRDNDRDYRKPVAGQPVYDRNGKQVGTVNAQGQVVANDANGAAAQVILDAIRR
jgi:hypothetical protein